MLPRGGDHVTETPHDDEATQRLDETDVTRSSRVNPLAAPGGDSTGSRTRDDAPTERLEDTGTSSRTASRTGFGTGSGTGSRTGPRGDWTGSATVPPPFLPGGDSTGASHRGEDPDVPRIGRYRIERELGGGAMGRVYLARDPMIDRLVALKTFKRTEEDVVLRRKLVEEAQKAAAISHPNVVTIYDVVEEGDGIFIAMEYVPGSSLEDRLEAGPLELHEAIEMVSQVASALDHLHLRGLVHRDLKPANILLTRDGTVKLADFGIAAATEGPVSTEVYGTPRYMAPEQITGETVDQRTDVFAVGVLFYEMISGKRPFPGQTVSEILQSVLHEDPVPLERHVEGLPPGIGRVVGRAIAKRPDKRHPTAGALARDLWRLDREEQKTEGGGRPPALVMGAVAAALVALAVVAFFFGRSRGGGDETVVATTAEEAQSYLPLLQEGRKRMEEGDFQAAMVLFSAAARLAPEPARVEELMEEARAMAEAEGVELLLQDARSALDAKRYDEVMATARSLLDSGSESGRAEALRVLAEVESAMERDRRSARRRSAPTPAPAASAASDGVSETAGPEAEAELEGPPERETAVLEIRLRSDAPKGILTVYVGSEQVLQQNFDFYERRGLFRKVSQGGTLEARIDVEPGEREIRVLVNRDKEAADGEVFRYSFERAERKELAIDLPEKGPPAFLLR